MASIGSTSGRPAIGVPGRGLRKLRGTSVGPTSRRSASSSSRCSSLSPIPRMAPQHSSIPASSTSRQVSRRSSHEWVVTTSREERAGRLQVVVVAVEAGVGQAPGLVGGEDAQAGGHVEPGALPDHRDHLDDPGQGALVGPPHGQHDAELRRPQAGRLLGRGQQLVRGRAGAWPAPASRSGPTGCRSGSPRGSPPVLPETMPSTSTVGPHQASRTWWARAPRAGAASIGRAASAASSSAVSRRRSSSRAEAAAARTSGTGRP